MHSILSNRYVSITEFKMHPNKVIEEAKTDPVAVLSHNKPRIYLVSTKEFEKYLSYQEEQKLLRRFKQVKSGNKKTINIENLADK